MRGKEWTLVALDAYPGITPAHAGKRKAASRQLNQKRITPAHAGKRQTHYSSTGNFRDHPRTCGEKGNILNVSSAYTGSPPHMRGKETNRRKRKMRYGITPAHAGKSFNVIRTEKFTWDHPRTCGEKRHEGCRIQPRKGSPPHMRGKAKTCVYSTIKMGITPAHAGKSVAHVPDPVGVGDHPRTCGEKYALIAKKGLRKGSPPHMRGKESM